MSEAEPVPSRYAKNQCITKDIDKVTLLKKTISQDI